MTWLELMEPKPVYQLLHLRFQLLLVGKQHLIYFFIGKGRKLQVSLQ